MRLVAGDDLILGCSVVPRDVGVVLVDLAVPMLPVVELALVNAGPPHDSERSAGLVLFPTIPCTKSTTASRTSWGNRLAVQSSPSSFRSCTYSSEISAMAASFFASFVSSCSTFRVSSRSRSTFGGFQADVCVLEELPLPVVDRLARCRRFRRPGRLAPCRRSGSSKQRFLLLHRVGPAVPSGHGLSWTGSPHFPRRTGESDSGGGSTHRQPHRPSDASAQRPKTT